MRYRQLGASGLKISVPPAPAVPVLAPGPDRLGPARPGRPGPARFVPGQL